MLALRNVVKSRRAWRGEVILEGRGDMPMPLLVRADPVFAAAGRACWASS